MPSPDQSSYNSLRLYDKSAYDLLATALTDAALKLPGFAPKVGTLEMAILEAQALIGSETIFAANRIPDGVFEILMGYFGIIRDLGVPPETTIEITAVDTTGYAIPAGVQFRYDDGAGNVIEFITDEAGIIGIGASSVTVPATATSNTDAFNGTPSGTPVTLISPISFIDSAELASVISGGAGVESDDEWRDRAVQILSTLTTVLVLATHFTARALADPAVYRAFTRDNWNVSTSAAGHVTVAVADSAGQPLSSGAKTALQTTLDDLALAALTVHVVDPNYNDIDVTVTAVAKTGYSTSAVEDAITQALEQYLSPTTWEWGGTVRLYELVSVIDQVDGVSYVDTVEAAISGDTLAAADVTLTGPFPLVTAGDIVVTVTGS